MKPTWVFASNNKHKLDEVREILGLHVNILSLNDIDCNVNPEETGLNFEENALIKCKAVSDFTQLPVLADDSGLIVLALNGNPGVKSARFAGENATDNENMHKLLAELEGVADRQAHFTACLCLYSIGTNPLYFQGEVHGKIITEPKGDKGFGYDPVFIPEGYSETFAELGADIKNTISHRKLALNKLLSSGVLSV
ncbi:MAG: RdgB/HAM1 family non-canonical purine NTP pyrophosphatase [Sphingomonadales bacterium]|nr:RdgB/HAM1 family non-canonical purine NTP pyrophosphatase [Sphingomonadales bacterium]